MVAPYKSLILPCETRNRELDGKLLLACAAAERGFRVFIGAKREINIAAMRLPRSIYLQKSLSKRSLRMYDILERVGHWIVAVDEEGVVYYSREHCWEDRIHPDTFRKARALLAWGPDNADLWRSYPAYDGAPIMVTGNPRVDLLRPELRAFFDEEVEEIRNRLGPFVMVNTNFGSVNHYFPRLRTGLRLARSQDPRTMASFDAGRARGELALFDAFKEMIPALARACPDRTFVVRPHPSESHDPYLQASSGCPNVHVIHEGNVVPWLIASDALIHNGCTTGLEGRLLGTTVIAYEPMEPDRFTLRLPNDLSHRARDILELTKLLDAAAEGTLDTSGEANKRALEERYLAALDGPLASDRMCDALEALEREWREEPLPGLWRRSAGRLHGQVRALEKHVNLFRPQHNNSRSYVERMFYELHPEDVDVRLSRFRAALGRFEKVQARRVSRNIFEIASA